MRFAVVFVVIAASLLCAERAGHACSPPRCRASWTAPDEGRSVPANTPALYLQYGSMPVGATPRLTAKDGSAIPFTADGPLLRLLSPLPMGDAVLRFDEACNAPPEAGLPERSINFKVTAAAPLPTKLGTVAASYNRGNATVATFSGSCTDVVDSALAKLTFSLDPAVEPYRSVLALRSDVDGKYWGASVFGRDKPFAHELVAGGGGMEAGLHRHDLIFAACGAVPDGVVDRGLSVGKHKVAITAIIAGAEPLPAITVDIELACASTPEPGSPEAGTPDDGSVIPDAATPSAAPDETSAGCGCTSAPTSPGATAALIFPLLALLRRRLDTALRPR